MELMKTSAASHAVCSPLYFGPVLASSFFPPPPLLGPAQNYLISNKCGTLPACSGADLRPVHFSWNFHPTFFPSGSKPWLTWVSLAFSGFSDPSAQCNANSLVSPLNKGNLTLITSHVISFLGAWVPVSRCLLPTKQKQKKTRVGSFS